jgi:hypothetical protein
MTGSTGRATDQWHQQQCAHQGRMLFEEREGRVARREQADGIFERDG